MVASKTEKGNSKFENLSTRAVYKIYFFLVCFIAQHYVILLTVKNTGPTVFVRKLWQHSSVAKRSSRTDLLKCPMAVLK